MITGLRKVKFVSKSDEGEVKTEFTLKPLKKSTLMSLDRFMTTDKDKVKDPEYLKEIVPEVFSVLKQSITNIKNFQFFGEDDALVTKNLSQAEITDEFIDDSIPLDLMMELFTKIVLISKLGTSEAKN